MTVVAVRPFVLLRERLDVVREQRNGFRARCPAHSSRGGTLSIREGTDGAVLLKCHAGCTAAQVVHAVGLKLSDLFPRTDAWRERQSKIAAEGRRLRQAPRATVRAAIEGELKRLHDQLVAENGFDRPLRAQEINEARARVGQVYRTSLFPVPPFAWECAPHDSDPEWRCLFERRLREVTIELWGDPDRAPSQSMIGEAQQRAAHDLHEIASEGIA